MNVKTQITDFSKMKASCALCNLQELCLPRGLEADELEVLEKLVKRSRPLHRSDYIFRAGDSFKSLYAVRSGTVKVYTTTDLGEEQIMGFYFPGEIIGFDAIESDKHVCTAVALETSSYCAFTFEKLEEVSGEIPEVRRQIYRLMSRELSSDNQLLLTLSNKAAEEKIATFLLSLSGRFQRLGYSANEFKLAMSRQEIGNYLGMTIETVSRIFSKLQRKDIISTNHKIIHIIDYPALENICTGMNDDNKDQSCIVA